MESTTGSRRASLAWKLVFLVPLAVALALLLLSSRQPDLHAQIALSTIGNIFVAISLVAQAVHLTVVGKRTGWGIATLIFASALLGFGLHTLLRVL